MRVDPGTLFAALLAVATLIATRWWPARREVADAGWADAQGWDLLIENLREEVKRLQADLQAEREARSALQVKCDRLDREVARLRRRR